MQDTQLHDARMRPLQIDSLANLQLVRPTYALAQLLLGLLPRVRYPDDRSWYGFPFVPLCICCPRCERQALFGNLQSPHDLVEFP